ncbi:MAG: hypothetical protein J6B24_06765 [Clostridia bacterium]|nr:hypothetical protein [Clostridia bacterium]
MKKNEIKGLSAFALLEGLDDDMILSASLPEAAPVAPPTVGEKLSAFFARMGKGGMAAAITGIVVAVAVLIGILLAGRFPIWEESGIETEPGPIQSRPDIQNGILFPPLESPDNTQKSAVSVVSDGITVYPKGYCVYLSEMRRDENGELTGVDADGIGAVYQLAEIWDELPTLQTAGDDFDVILPDHMTLRSVQVFEMVEVQTKTFEEIASTVDGPNLSVDPMGYLSTLRGEYTVVLKVYHEINYSADEYTKGLEEYAFRLNVDPTMNEKAPVRVIHGDKTYFPAGYLLQTSYYDAELKQEITKQYDGAESILAELATDMVTATVARGESLGLYLAPFYELKWVRVFDSSLRQLYEMGYDSPLDTFSETEEAGDYYVIITAVFLGTGETSVTEFPIHIKLVEEREEESTPAGDVGETPPPPRVTVSTGFGSLSFGNASHSSEYHEGYMLWTEQWYDGGMLSGDGFGATGQLSDISAGLPVLRHYAGEEPHLRVIEDKDTLTRIYIYYEDHSFCADARDALVLSTLPEGSYIIVLRVETQGDYIEEAEAYERTCTEYAFILEVVEEHAGIPGVPETNPRVVVSGGGQSAVFETEEDGFLAWTAYRLGAAVSWMPRMEGTPAASVIFDDDDAMRALPDMEITYGTPLTLSLDAAGDALFKVILYDAKGGVTAEGLDLSVVDSLENDGWDRGVILVLQIMSRISETEQACYEYAIDLTITQP